MFGMLANNWFVNAFAFDGQMPDFECQNKETGNWKSCKPEEFCGEDIEHRINWDSPKSLHNFVGKLNLTCLKKTKIGFMFAAFFLGWVISLLY